VCYTELPKYAETEVCNVVRNIARAGDEVINGKEE
jgi:hypothetical protein